MRPGTTTIGVAALNTMTLREIRFALGLSPVYMTDLHPDTLEDHLVTTEVLDRAAEAGRRVRWEAAKWVEAQLAHDG